MGLGFLYAARHTLILFLFSIFFAYLINPAVERLEKLLRSRVWAIAVIYLLLLVALGVFGFLVGPRIARQSARLAASMPGLIDNANNGQFTGPIGRLAEQIGHQHGWSEDTQKQIQAFLISRRENLFRIAQYIGVRVAESAQQLWVLFLVPILAIFFLRDGGSFHEVILSLVQSRTQREFLQDVLQDLNQMLAQFIRAQLTLAAFSFMAYAAVLGCNARSIRAHARYYGRRVGVHPGCWTAGCRRRDDGRSDSGWIRALGLLAAVLDRLADSAGLRNLSSRYGSQGRVTSAGCFVRHPRGRRNRRSARRLPLHTCDGQFADCLAALAYLRGKTQVRAAQRILVSAGTRPGPQLSVQINPRLIYLVPAVPATAFPAKNSLV